VVWDTAQFALNGVMFVLLGEQLPVILDGALSAVGPEAQLDPWWLAGTALAISAGLTVMRFVWVWVSLRLALLSRRREGAPARRPSVKLVLATSLAGVRGAITMAGVMTLPLALPDGAPFPGRQLAIFLAAAVIIVSLVLASVALPRLLRGLEVPEEPALDAEEAEARQQAALAAIAAVEQAAHAQPHDSADADLVASAADHVMGLYQHRLGRAAANAGEAARVRAADQAERALRLAALQAERGVILKLARAAAITDETARKLLREIDLTEARYR
jgi:CPA1 family monovalent cation:H+ antiporter